MCGVSGTSLPFKERKGGTLARKGSYSNEIFLVPKFFSPDIILVKTVF
jgi:hypothetical protein